MRPLEAIRLQKLKKLIQESIGMMVDQAAVYSKYMSLKLHLQGRPAMFPYLWKTMSPVSRQILRIRKKVL